MDSHTEVFAVIGNPVKHSLSPFMHNFAFELLSLNAVYTAFEISDLESAVKGIRGLGIKGVSVTVPHKENIIKYLDEISDSSLKIGAVNTVTNKNGILEGDNTDWKGFILSLKEHSRIKDRKTLVIGAGGASRGVCYGLASENADIYITNRTKSKGIELARDFDGEFVGFEEIEKLEPEIIINTTSVGMYPDIDKSPVEKTVFKTKGTAIDIVYNPLNTKFLKDASMSGFKTVSGVGMFVYQGGLQFEKWTNIRFPFQIMKEKIFHKLMKG
ncbi:MAG: shikimate dehydrogenase [Desulforegulaceae bacterium]|nr:shikimate dehydrogenase [Desulforegulaceae bacterium]